LQYEREVLYEGGFKIDSERGWFTLFQCRERWPPDKEVLAAAQKCKLIHSQESGTDSSGMLSASINYAK